MGEVQSEEMVEKLKDNFDEMVVYKDLKKAISFLLLSCRPLCVIGC